LSSNNTDLNDVLSQLNIPDYYSSLGIRVVKAGKKHQAECPFCYDPDHFAYEPTGPKQGLWVCPKCNESGNAITLTAKLLNLSNRDAVQHIKKYLGIEDDPQWEGKGAGKMTSKQQKKAGKATKTKQQPLQPKENNEGSMAPSSAIYDRFLELTHLTDSDREDLKKKRGFTDALIDELKFRSGGNYIVDVVAELRKEFADDDLVSKGILKRVNGALIIEEQLLDDKKLKRGRYLIPYLDKNGHCYHIRPHKLGFKGISAQLYCEYLLNDKPDWVILTEGEFKAAALKLWGIPGLAQPGTPSFAKSNFDRLKSFLVSHEIKRVIVINDSEEKGNPAFPNYKPDPEKRYDTEFWTYLTAYKLNKAGFDTSIGFLPAEWRENGKIDFDAALAQGRTKSDIEKIINSSITPDEFRKSWEGEAKRILERKLAREFTKLPIKKDFNRYIAERRTQKGEVYEQVISNFVINIKANFYTDDGIIRQVELVNQFGDRSHVFSLEASPMAGVNEFKKFCFNKGNYVFNGTAQDLNNIWEFEFLHDTGEIIYMPEHIGKISPKIWLFGNMAIKDGKIYRPDDNGIIWIDDKGYKPQSQNIEKSFLKNEADINSIPALSERPVDIHEIVQKLHHTLNGYEAEIMIGWVIATIFSDDIFKRHRCFPLLFAYGKMRSGKSTALSWISCFFGKREEGYKMDKSTTQNGIIRAASYRGSLGTWFDEYRNSDNGNKADLFRSMFNRQASLKGTNSSFKIKTFNTNSTIMLSGEETPEDAAFFSRCIFIKFSEYKRRSEYKDWLDAHCEEFSAYTLDLILHYDEYKERILSDIKDLQEALIQKGIPSRAAENWAIAAGAYSAVVKFDPNFIKWVEKTCQEAKISDEQGHMINLFWDDLLVLYTDKEIDRKYISVEGDYLYVWFMGAYDKWAVHYKKKTGKEAFERNTMLKYITDEPYYVEKKTRRMKGVPKTVHVIKISDATETVKELAEAIKEIDGTDQAY